MTTETRLTPAKIGLPHIVAAIQSHNQAKQTGNKPAESPWRELTTLDPRKPR